VVLPPDQHLTILRSVGSVPSIDRMDWTRAEVLKSTDGGSVLKWATDASREAGTHADAASRVLIAKTMRQDGFDRLKCAAHASRLHRQWRGSERLAGIAPTAPLIALVRGQRDQQSVLTLLMGEVPGPTLLEQMATGAADDLAEPVGSLLGRLTRSRLFNRDPKPSNLIVSPDGLAMIDTVAIRRTLQPVRSLARMLAALVLEPTSVGCPPGRDWIERAARAALREAGLRYDTDRLCERVDKLVTRYGISTPMDNLRD